MPLVPNFTATQTTGLPSKINLEDTSTGSDGTVDTRHVLIQTSQGGYLVEDGTETDYEVWPYDETEITLDVLDKDYGVKITVQWLDSGGEILYSKELYFGFTLYNEIFDYGLTQMLAANPLLISDNNFFQNKSIIRTYIDAGNQAISLASDTVAAQQCYDLATELRLNSSYHFNINS